MKHNYVSGGMFQHVVVAAPRVFQSGVTYRTRIQRMAPVVVGKMAKVRVEWAVFKGKST